MEIKELYRFLRHPIKYIIYHSQDYDKLSKDYNRLSQQCADEANKNAELIDRNKGLDFQVKQLSEDLNALDNTNTVLKAELENANAKNKVIISKNKAYERKFAEYKDKVRNSGEFKQEKVKVDNLSIEKAKLEGRVSELTEKISGFDVIYRQQKSTIARLHQGIESYYKNLRKEGEHLLEQIGEDDKKESSIYVGGSGRIIASTPVFDNKFGFDNPEDPIKGKMYFRVLHPPKDAPDYQEKGKYVYDIKYAFRNPEEVTLQTTIVDGKGRSRIIQFTKHKPYHIKIVKADKCGQELSTKDYFYTKVDVYVIGRWEKIGEELKKILHIKNGEPEELHEFTEKKAVQRIQDSEQEEKEYHQKMAPVYVELISYDCRFWTADKISHVEKEMGIKGAEAYLIGEYEKIPKMQKQKNELISQTIRGVIEHKKMR